MKRDLGSYACRNVEIPQPTGLDDANMPAEVTIVFANTTLIWIFFLNHAIT